jgi:hypothetical protein
MTPQIAELIEGTDNFEIIRDQIAAILVLESTAQQALATAAAKDSGLWKLRVFAERSNPIEAFQAETKQADGTPVVNVWFDNASFDASSSNTVERQKATGTFNVDCYGYGITADDAGIGHQPGDEKAALEAHRALRLCRRILMAGTYTYLGLRKTVWKRWTQSVTVFQPQMDGRPMQHVVGARLALAVDFNEFSPQFAGSPFETVTVALKRKETGEIYLTAEYGSEDS